MYKLNYFRKYDAFKDFPYTDLIEKILPKDLNLPVSEEYDLTEKLYSAYLEGKSLGLSNDNIEKILIIITRSVCSGVLASENEMPFYIGDILDELLNNELFLKKESYETGFFSVLRRMYKYIISLKEDIVSKKYYAALKDFALINRYLLAESITDEMSKEEKKRELEKIYGISDRCFLSSYYERMDNKKYKDIRYLKLDEELHIPIYSFICNLFSIYFADFMYGFYKENNYLYRAVSDDFSLYYLNGITILAYRYEDSVNISFKFINNYIGMKNYRYYALVLNSKVSESLIRRSIYLKCDDVTGQKADLICPEEFLDASLFEHVNKEVGNDEALRLLNKNGLVIDKNDLNKIWYLYDGRVIKNPKMVENIRVKDINDYETLRKILSLSGEKREKYISKIFATSKGVATKEFRESDSNISFNNENNKKAYID